MQIDRINISEALGYMGIHGKPDPEFLDEVNTIANKLLKTYSPHFLYEKYSIEAENNALRIVNTPVLLCGKDITAHLRNCSDIILLAATLSFKADNLIKSYQIIDMKKAVIADALANALIEQVCDAAEDEIRAACPSKKMTFRYSPGYGDFDISMQKSLSVLLNTQKKIGIFVNDSYMMVPSKSVIAVIGLSY